MSALPPKADIVERDRHVRFVPKADILRCSEEHVCPARIKDVTRIAELGSGNVDDCLGVSRLCFCALRNVETSSQSDCELKSEAGQDARPFLTQGQRCGLLHVAASNSPFWIRCENVILCRHCRVAREPAVGPICTAAILIRNAPVRAA